MPHTFIIFGASGDLTSRKLIPALYNLRRKGRLPEDTKIVGVSRTEFSHDQWRKSLAESTAKFAGDAFDSECWEKFAQQVFYQPGDVSTADDFAKLKAFLAELEGGKDTTRVYYLSMAPRFYGPTIQQLGAAGMAGETDDCRRRVVIEKP
ncbi:MAG: glucose-6-phosphate dehydrogenase, partial [Planctomycetales bacterium]|nr:glucose-6-phosphate dehydrogenase [Planctomycetales bacterium]